MAVNISLPSLPSFASVPAQGFQINPSTIPSSCTNVWPGIHNLDASIVIGRSCAVFTSQGCSNSWDCTGVACNTLNSLCSTQFSTDFLQYIATGTVTGTTSISGYYPDSKNLGMTGSLVSASSYNPSWKYTAKPPCCGSCSLDGGTVQVYVWPSTDATKPSAIAADAADKNQSATVTSSRNQTARTLVSDGFTFTSPLIYVAFQSMVAHDYCGPVGSSYTMTTLSFPPNQLMTGASVIDHLRLPRYSGYSDFVWTTMNPYDLTAKCGIKTVKGLKGNVQWQNATDPSVFYGDPQELKTAGDVSHIFVQSITYDPCKPLLSVPRTVYNLDPAWSTCTAGISGLWDPPRVLQPASGPLTPDPTTTPQAQTVLTSSAAPASAVAPTTPTATTSAGPAPKPSQVIPASSSSRSDADPGSTAEPGANRDSAIIPKQDPSQDPGFFSDSTASTHSEPDIPKNGGLRSFSKKPTQLQSQNTGPPTANLDSPAPPSSPITGSHTALGLPSKGLSVNSAILTAGSTPVTLDNIPVSVATAYAGIGTSRPALANIPSDTPSFNGHQIEVASDGRVIAAGTTLSQGGSGVTISGTEASLGGSGLVIGTSTFAIRSSTPAIAPTLPSIGGQQVQVDPHGDVIIGGTTLSHGGSAATVAGTAVSLGADGFIIGTSTFIVPTPASASTLPLVGGQAVQVAPSGNVVIAGTTISPGKAGAIISGTPVSLGPNGLIIGHSTFTVAVSPIAPTLPLIGGQRIHPAADGGFVVASTTLQPGAPGTVVSGTSVSLGSQGLVIGSSTYAPPKQQLAAVYTIGGETLIAAPSSAVLVAGQTLSIGGPAVTISKTDVSLGSAGLVVGSKTYNIPTYSNEAPSLITFGIGGTAAISALANSSVVAFTAQAGRCSGVWNKYTLFLSAVVAAGFGVFAFTL